MHLSAATWWPRFLFKMENRELIKYFRENDIIQEENNVFFAKKAFKLNVILKWCMKQDIKVQANILLSGVIDSFIAGNVDMNIEDNQLIIERRGTK